MKWFGESWGAPVCEHTEQVPVPLGEMCEQCAVYFAADDRGIVMPFHDRDAVRDYPVHLDCFLEMLGIKP